MSTIDLLSVAGLASGAGAVLVGLLLPLAVLLAGVGAAPFSVLEVLARYYTIVLASGVGPIAGA